MKVLVLAGYTWKRMARAHYLKGMGAFWFIVAMLMIGSRSDAESQVSLTSLMEFGMRLARGGTWLAALWIGASILSGELSSFTARTLLTKPIRRFDAVFGTALGGAYYLTLFHVSTTLLVFVLSVFRGWRPESSILGFQLSVLPPIYAVLAMAQLVSLVTPKPLTLLFSGLLTFEHIWDYMALGVTEKSHPGWFEWSASIVFQTLYYVTPTYSRFVADYQYFLTIEFPWSRYVFHVLGCAAYVTVACAVAAWVLSRKEI